ncbi:MAG: hypothetical protein OEZ06_13435 [Myxococcales bacterium]|nr:hypothetical protein [Myxococcales bacterium]
MYVSDVCIEVVVDRGLVDQALPAVWSHAMRPLMPSQRRVRFELGGSDALLTLSVAGSELASCPREEGPMALLDCGIYRAMAQWHCGRALLHAAAVVIGDRGVVLCGPSGAGKSTFAWHAVESGADYFSDELTVCDGARLWGVPRAIQLSAVEAGGPLPPWVVGADVDSYRLRTPAGAQLVIPLRAVPAGRVPASPSDPAKAAVVVLERSDSDRLGELKPLEILGALHEASFTPSTEALSSLVHQRRGAHLRWRDPARALDLLVDWLQSKP